MQDPMPENIDGSKVEQHVFEHRINWGYLIAGLAAMYAVYTLTRLYADEDQGNTQDGDGRHLEVME